MLSKNRTYSWAGSVLSCLLVALTAYLLYTFTFGNYGEFDPEQRWLNVQALPTLTELNLTANTGLTLIHVREPYCSCNPLANAHTAEVPAHVTQHWLTAEQLNKAGFTVPAIPMALIYERNTLIYAGPYASGPLCSTDNSLIADILNQQQQLAGPFLNGLIQACRCLT